MENIKFGDKSQRDVYLESLQPKQKISFWDSKEQKCNCKYCNGKDITVFGIFKMLQDVGIII